MFGKPIDSGFCQNDLYEKKRGSRCQLPRPSNQKTIWINARYSYRPYLL